MLLGFGSLVPSAFGQTDGSAALSVRINNYTGESGSEHWTVAWVTSGSDTFIKTLWRQGPSITRSSWNSHCRTWYQAKGGSGGSTAFDGYSSATTYSYATGVNNPIDPVWDCRDASDNLVPDGSYKFYVQYAEDDGQGPVTSALEWTKGPAAFSQSYPIKAPKETRRAATTSPKCRWSGHRMSRCSRRSLSSNRPAATLATGKQGLRFGERRRGEQSHLHHQEHRQTPT